MSARERLIAILLGGFIVAGVVGLLAYLTVISPYQDKMATIEDLEKKVADKESKKKVIDAGKGRYAELKSISLPPEPNTAQREYNYVLTQLLNRANISAGSRTVNVKLLTDKTTIPLVNPGVTTKDKKYAYQKIAADITMSKVNLSSIMKFLTSYQQLGLMQHITKLTVKLSETDAGGSLGGGGGGGGRRGGGGGGGGGGNRNDLTVALTTEAIILDGLEPRDSLVKIPKPVAAVGGSAVYFALDNNPDVGRSLVLNRPSKSLPTEQYPRDYSAMVYRDPFHGTVPPPPTPGTIRERILPSVAEFIHVSGWATNSNGSAVVDITDIANNFTYEINLSRKGEKLHTVIKKQRFQEGRAIAYTLVPDTDIKSWVDKPFTISDATVSTPATSSTKRTFTVHGLVSFGIILSSTADDDKQEAAPQGAGRGGRGGFGGGRGGGGFGTQTAGRGGHPKPTASEAIAGTAVTQKAEKYYIWSVGQPLSALKEVPSDKVDELLRNAMAPLMPAPAVAAPVATAAGEGR